jgi:hypothetical protein
MNRSSEHDRLPAELADRLRNATDHQVFVPDEVDQRVLAAASAHLREHGRPALKRGLGWWLPRVAAAACLVIAVGIVSREMGMPSRVMNAGEATPAVALEGDIDGDGVVDIVDAYLLAKRAGGAVELPDLNGDGAVDRTDADLLALRIVALGKGAS